MHSGDDEERDSHGRREEIEGSQISWGSGSTGRRRTRLKFCDCGVETPLLTAKNGKNQERRLYGCGLYQVGILLV